MAYQVMSRRFVGRSQELARLRQLLARAADGTPLVALIGGEAGVGKTRLVEQLAAARGQGVRVLRGGLDDQADPGDLHAGDGRPGGGGTAGRYQAGGDGTAGSLRV
jgi:MoxR-like ATPase